MMKITIIKLTAIVLAVIVAFWTIVKCSASLGQSETPAETLAATIKALEVNDLKRATRILDLKSDTIPWKHWILLYQGLVLEKLEKNFAEAYKLFEQVDQNSAASPEAKLALLRLKNQNPTRDYGKIIANLETELSLTNREDLRPELLLLQAIEAEKNNLQLALSIYALLREKYTTSPAAKQAKENYYRIYSSNAVSLGEISVAEHLAEGKRLLAEGDLTHALERVHNAKAMVAERSNAYLEALVLEADILKKQQRNLEADRMLSIVANEGGLGTADLALITLAKSYWNANENSKALSTLQTLIHKYPSSPAADEALYLEGRVYEDLNKSAEAKDCFQTLSTSSKSPLKKAQALRRIAWNYLLQNNYSFAAQYFNKARQQAENAINKPVIIENDEGNSELAPIDKLSDLIYELEHSLYWEGFALSQLPTSANATNEPWQKLLSQNPYGYYGQMVSSIITPGSSVLLPQEDANCSTPVSPLLLNTLHAFSIPELKILAQHEIDWAYKVEELPKPPFEIKIDSNETIKNLSTKIKLTISYGLIQQAIGLGQRILTQTYRSQATLSCINNLRALIYPRPYKLEIQKAAEEANIDRSLIYGVARTESHFDPLAKSSANALGLMQLLPTTAQSFGCKTDTELYIPTTNLSCGAKYLSELLKQHQNNKTYAIAAYNAGPTAVLKWKERFPNIDNAQFIEMIPFNETRDYVKKVLSAEMLYRGTGAKLE